MKWILEHLQIVLAVGAAFAYWLNQRKEARQAKEQEPPRPGADFPSEDHDFENVERTRQIQEEIRRKIAERRGATPPSPAPVAAERTVAPPVLSSQPRSEGGLREKIETQLAQARRREVEERLVLERQQQLEARMRALEAEQNASQQRATEIAAAARTESRRIAASEVTANALATMDARAWLDGLRHPQVARRAMVLREVLGPPVGLQ